MPLYAFVSSLDQVEERFQDLYEEASDGSGYVLSAIEDKDYKKKLDEFRQNNIQLQNKKKELEQQMDKFKGIDPDKYQQALEAWKELDQMKDKDLYDQGNIDELLEKRTKQMKEQYDNQLSELQKARDDAYKKAENYFNQLNQLAVNNAVQTAINKIGQPRQGALDDILNRARAAFTVDEDGQLKPNEVYNEKGEPIQSVDEWAGLLVKNAPHLFESGGGSGSTGGSKGAGAEQQKTVSNDPIEFGKNLDEIASGKVKVAPATQGTQGSY